MKPRVICHMLCSLDGRTDGDALDAAITEGEYDATAAVFESNAWLCGRATMQEILGDDVPPFVSADGAPSGPRATHVARQADSYAVSVDTLGKLNWPSGDLRGDHLICIVSERAPAEYVRHLRERGISFIVAGESSVDLARALEELGGHFGIRTLLLEGGGHINGAFLQAGLVDEVSIVLVPGIDGRKGIATIFDGLPRESAAAFRLRLKSSEPRAGDTLWLRYEVVRS